MQKNRRYRLKQTCGLLLATLLLGLYGSPEMRDVRALPDTVRLSEGEQYRPEVAPGARLSFAGSWAASRSGAETLDAVADVDYTYRLFGVIPMKTVSVVRSEPVLLTPGGTAVGITIRTEGVLVVGLGSVDTESGAVSPAAAGGIHAGDTIRTVNGKRVRSAGELLTACRTAAGGTLTLGVERDGASLSIAVRPAVNRDGEAQLGMWVRDSTAGVGTLSFFDEATGGFAALGHPVSDADTKSALTVREGRIVPAEVVDVVRGEQGAPGELLGVFSTSGRTLGDIRQNTEYGIYGTLREPYRNPNSGAVPLAYADEARIGSAVLLTTVPGAPACAYACEISRVSTQTAPQVKGMVVTVTDPALIAKTGGIVQGMSGSPVLQDGKLIGVITHVFVNDPKKGYCVYAEWMYGEMRQK